tara:strand:- start:157 stop:342 length:186 start_codon:yes stop_codon:yes gene_type:complete
LFGGYLRNKKSFDEMEMISNYARMASVVEPEDVGFETLLRTNKHLVCLKIALLFCLKKRLW